MFIKKMFLALICIIVLTGCASETDEKNIIGGASGQAEVEVGYPDVQSLAENSETDYIRKDISESELQSAEMSIVEGMFTIDVNSYPLLAGNADYVLIGKVLEMVSVEYRNGK